MADDELRYGRYNLSGGELNVYGGMMLGGNSDSISGGYLYGGLGVFNQSGGTSFMHDLIIGDEGIEGSGEGHVKVSGSSKMNVSGSILVGAASEIAPAVATFEQDLLEVSGFVFFGSNTTIDLLFGYKPENQVVVKDFFDLAAPFQMGEGFDPEISVHIRISCPSSRFGLVPDKGSGGHE